MYTPHLYVFSHVEMYMYEAASYKHKSYEFYAHTLLKEILNTAHCTVQAKGILLL